jgi:hypothetical protein
LRLFRIGLTVAALILASAWAAKADGIDPVLKMGGGGGSPPCVSNGVSYQATTDSSGGIDLSNGACVNNTGEVITSFSFDILCLEVPGCVPGGSTGITPRLDCLLAPFQAGCPSADPEDVSKDWTVSCTQIDGGTIDSCTASKPPSQCEDECETSSEGNEGDECTNFFPYIQFGVLPGCDLSVSTVTDGGTFDPNSPFDIVPDGVTPASLVPEPASLAMLLFGLGGLPFLRRRFSR